MKAKEIAPVEERVARGEIPPSRIRKHLKPDPAKVQRLPPPNKQELRTKLQGDRGRQIGIVRPLPAASEPLRQAARFDAPEGEVFVMGFVSEGALRVRLRLTEVDLPPGARLYVYSASNPEDMYGPYERRGPFGDGTFWTPPMQGESVVLEYVRPRTSSAKAPDSEASPNAVSGNMPFRVESLSHTYRDSTPAEPRAESCQLPVPPAWQSTANGVAAIDFINDNDAAEVDCSGTLLNSQAQDLTPYLLTANHCIGKEEEARSARVWWFFDAPGQALASKPYSDFTTLLSTRDAITGSEYTLLMILGAVPDGLTWSGWTPSLIGLFTPVVGLHHPNNNVIDAQAYTRFSFGSTVSFNLFNCPFTQITCSNFLFVDWDPFGGVTEEGSSGSGLWAMDALNGPVLVGHLKGGKSACGKGDPNEDYYGRFDLTYREISTSLAGGVDDSSENNDNSSVATSLTAGANLTNRIVKIYDEDWYRISVPASSRVKVAADFEHDFGDIDLQLYRAGAAIPVASSTSVGDAERVEHINTAGASDYFFHVSLYSSTRNTYNLRVSVVSTAQSPPPTVQFSTPNYSAGEGTGLATISVTRAGDTTNSVSVKYMTVDNPSAVRCDAASTIAFARCDYATTVDTLTFAPGEVTKTFTIPLVNDAHDEGNEVVTLRLLSPTGGIAGATTTATLTITDNDTGVSTNPISDSGFFLRMQYLDFLNREPDPNGFQNWLNLLNSCPSVNNSPTCDRIFVSGVGFFRSLEFQLKGGYVFRFYPLAFGRLPAYDEITPDMRAVTGQTPKEVFTKKADFADSFAQRPEFQNLYGGLSNSGYVTALLSRYGLVSISTPEPLSPDGAFKVQLTAVDLINLLNLGVLSRAQVLRAVADSDQVSFAEFNRTFVAMQYYGYLRRTPEQPGYNNWLNYLNTHPTDSRTMVNGFLNSTEYRLRFGRP
jgi:hypothetical protein